MSYRYNKHIVICVCEWFHLSRNDMPTSGHKSPDHTTLSQLEHKLENSKVTPGHVHLLFHEVFMNISKRNVFFSALWTQIIEIPQPQGFQLDQLFCLPSISQKNCVTILWRMTTRYFWDTQPSHHTLKPKWTGRPLSNWETCRNFPHLPRGFTRFSLTWCSDTCPLNSCLVWNVFAHNVE